MKSKKARTKSRKAPQRQIQKPGQRARAEVASKLSRRQADAVQDAAELVDEGSFQEAEEILLELNRKGTFLAVIELLASLYFETKQFADAAEQSLRLMKLVPKDPDARLRYASAVMYEGFATIALAEFEEFRRRWPFHESIVKIRDLCQVLTEEVENRIRIAQFPAETGWRLQILHEESLLAMNHNRFDDAIDKCKRILDVAPGFCSARNNLALAYFQSGNHLAAIEIAEATRQLAPDNRYAACLLAKLRFLGGHLERPEALIAELLTNPPDNQDAAIQAAEWLAMAGYDEELVQFLGTLPESVWKDPVPRGMALHLEAYGRCRLGQRLEAERHWKKSIRILPQGSSAGGNLDELRDPVENACWPCSMSLWIPKLLAEQFREDSQKPSFDQGPDAIPSHLKNLLPVFLDRGDPSLRKLAVAMYLKEGSNESLDRLQQFALSSRGSDSLRNEILMFLLEQGRIDKGPHRFFSHGKYVDVELRNLEIYSEPVASQLSKELTEKMSAAIQAIHQNQLARAECLLQEILREVPDSKSAQFNLATIWLGRDGHAGKLKAQALFESIYQSDPEYLFAGVGLAQLHGMRGEFEKAAEIMNRYSQRERLHVTEAKALYVVQVQIAIAEGNREKALSILTALESFAAGEPEVIQLRKTLEARLGW